MAIRILTIRRLCLHTISTSPLPRSLSTTPESKPESESETRISTAVSILLRHRSKTRWNYLKSSFPIGSTFSPPESAQIILRIRNNPRLALRFFNSSLCSHSLSSYSTIIHVLGRARLRTQTRSLIRSAILSLPESDNPLQLFQTLANTYRSCDSAPFVFDLLIEAYLQSKKLDRAVQIARILISRKIRPLVSASNSLIRFVCQSQGFEAGFEIYKELFDSVRVLPNVRVFNTLLLACYREGKLGMVEEIKKEMERFDCEPNVYTCSILMAGFCDEGMVDEAEKIWREMEGNCLKPDVMAFNTMIKGYCEVKEMEKAEELFREMGLSEVEPSCTTFEHLIRGYCSIGDVDSALALCRDLKRRGHGVENVVVDEVIEGLCERKRVGEGLRILREEMRREGFEPSRRSYELLIKGFCGEGDMETATKIQAAMAGQGHKVDAKVYEDFVDGYKRLGDEEKVARLEKEMTDMGMQRDDFLLYSSSDSS